MDLKSCILCGGELERAPIHVLVTIDGKQGLAHSKCWKRKRKKLTSAGAA